MTYKTLILSTVAILSLAACDGGKKDDKDIVNQDKAVATEAASITETVMETVAEMVTLDTSSVDAFKSSLSAMKDSLSDTDKSKLTSALGNLAQKAVSEKSEGDGLMDMAKSVTSGDSVEDQIYSNFKDELSGMNFEDLTNFAE